MPEPTPGRAAVLIPQAWLAPNLSLDAVRALQGAGTHCALERGDLRLAGIEVLIARSWVLEDFWPRIQDTVERGYAAEKTYTFLRVQGERRVRRRAENV